LKNIKYRFNAIKPEYPKGKNKVEVEKKKGKRRKNEAPQNCNPTQKNEIKKSLTKTTLKQNRPPKKDPYINAEGKKKKKL
jgi:hypothetical protein